MRTKKVNPTEPRTEPTYVSLMATKVEQGDMIVNPVVAEAEQEELVIDPAELNIRKSP